MEGANEEREGKRMFLNGLPFLVADNNIQTGCLVFCGPPGLPEASGPATQSQDRRLPPLGGRAACIPRNNN